MNLNATIFFQTIVFFLLGWFTMKFVWPPLIKSIEDRQKKIADGLHASEKNQSILSETKKKIALLEEETRKKIETRLLETEKNIIELVEIAKKDAQIEREKILNNANQEIEREIQKVRLDLHNELVNLVIQGAEKVLKREIDLNNHSDLINNLKIKL